MTPPPPPRPTSPFGRSRLRSPGHSAPASPPPDDDTAPVTSFGRESAECPIFLKHFATKVHRIGRQANAAAALKRPAINHKLRPAIAIQINLGLVRQRLETANQIWFVAALNWAKTIGGKTTPTRRQYRPTSATSAKASWMTPAKPVCESIVANNPNRATDHLNHQPTNAPWRNSGSPQAGKPSLNECCSKTARPVR